MPHVQDLEPDNTMPHVQEPNVPLHDGHMHDPDIEQPQGEDGLVSPIRIDLRNLKPRVSPLRISLSALQPNQPPVVSPIRINLSVLRAHQPQVVTPIRINLSAIQRLQEDDEESDFEVSIVHGDDTVEIIPGINNLIKIENLIMFLSRYTSLSYPEKEEKG